MLEVLCKKDKTILLLRPIHFLDIHKHLTKQSTRSIPFTFNNSILSVPYSTFHIPFHLTQTPCYGLLYHIISHPNLVEDQTLDKKMDTIFV